MARGVFSGVIWGTVVAGLGAGGLSLAYPDFKPGGSDAMPKDMAMAEPAKEDMAAAVVEAPMEKAAELEATEPEAMSEERAEPDVVDPIAPEPEPIEPEVAEAEDSPVEAPDLPEPELAEPDVAPADASVSELPEADTTETQVSEVEMAENEAGEEPAITDSPVADPAELPDVTEPEVAEPELTEPEVEMAEQTPVEEVVDPVTEDVAPSITEEIIAALPKPEGTVGDLAPDVTTNRLPSLGDDDEVAAEEGTSIATLTPFEQFQSAFEPKSDKPRMSIVLIDDGEGVLGVEALEAFPYPLTFAVDATKPDAGARMQVYRDKGFEVLALVDLPRGATPSDVEVAMSAYLAAVPEAVGILEGVATGVQTSREMADQLTQIILASGHGMLLQSSGLNTARKLAEREGIPAASVFRDFDGNGQSASVMRRFLDQAAFRAGQEGGVVMMGRLQAETISALLIWGLADRASRVALVPVSDVLKQDKPEG